MWLKVESTRKKWSNQSTSAQKVSFSIFSFVDNSFGNFYFDHLAVLVCVCTGIVTPHGWYLCGPPPPCFPLPETTSLLSEKNLLAVPFLVLYKIRRKINISWPKKGFFIYTVFELTNSCNCSLMLLFKTNHFHGEQVAKQKSFNPTS